jgi:hypothetical protein
VSALREANIYERQSYRHIIGQPSILFEDKGEVRSGAPGEAGAVQPVKVRSGKGVAPAW